ncbi:hypothetical protein [Candidatus Leptofilum sp.]|uniref:hypothetical protein n=1 Tax=Candidatus Leptofilum sp. TaxID=3241576 RepID=UPI003B59D62E
MFTDRFFSRNMLRPAFLLPLAILIVSFLTLAISPTARAAVQSLLSFNGVEVTVDPETGGLRAEGNSEAIIYQDDNTVFVVSEDGSTAVGVSHGEREPQLMLLDEVAAAFPDFELPTNLPDGYTLEPNADILFGKIVTVRWRNEAGDTITYWWGTAPAQPELASSAEEAAPVEITAENAQQMTSRMEPYQIMQGPDGSEIAVLRSEEDGALVQVIATDTALSVETLQAIIP